MVGVCKMLSWYGRYGKKSDLLLSRRGKDRPKRKLNLVSRYGVVQVCKMLSWYLLTGKKFGVGTNCPKCSLFTFSPPPRLSLVNRCSAVSCLCLLSNSKLPLLCSLATA